MSVSRISQQFHNVPNLSEESLFTAIQSLRKLTELCLVKPMCFTRAAILFCNYASVVNIKKESVSFYAACAFSIAISYEDSIDFYYPDISEKLELNCKERDYARGARSIMRELNGDTYIVDAGCVVMKYLLDGVIDTDTAFLARRLVHYSMYSKYSYNEDEYHRAITCIFASSRSLQEKPVKIEGFDYVNYLTSIENLVSTIKNLPLEEILKLHRKPIANFLSAYRSILLPKEIDYVLVFKRISKRPLAIDSVGELIYSGEGSEVHRVGNDLIQKNFKWMEPSVREIGFLTALKHPNIIRLNSFRFVSRSSFIIQTEEHPGTLAEEISRGPIAILRCRKLAKSLFSGLVYISSFGIIHGDIKPENLLISLTNDLIICDFANSMHCAIGKGDAYLFPEKNPEVVSLPYRDIALIRACAEDRYEYFSSEIDVWAAGIVLYECAFGRDLIPFDDIAENIVKPRMMEGLKRLGYEPNLELMEEYSIRMQVFDDIGHNSYEVECVAYLEEELLSGHISKEIADTDFATTIFRCFEDKDIRPTASEMLTLLN